MRGQHVFQLTLHVIERAQSTTSDSGSSSGGSDDDEHSRCQRHNAQTFIDYWSKMMSTASRRATAASWTRVSIPLPPLRCRYLCVIPPPPPHPPAAAAAAADQLFVNR